MITPPDKTATPAKKVSMPCEGCGISLALVDEETLETMEDIPLFCSACSETPLEHLRVRHQQEKPYTCVECGTPLSFPTTLFVGDIPYCSECVPTYNKDDQW